MLKFHRTSLMTSNAQTVVNTVNTVGVMGKGLAAAFKERYPSMFDEYKSLCKKDELRPGSSWLWKGNGQWVLNFATKKHWRNPSKLDYVREGLQEFRAKYSEWGIREIAFPRLGCGNGGLDWDVVRPIMVEHLRGLPIAIYIHDFEKPIGKLEHDLPLMQSTEPNSFEAFCSDLKMLIQKRGGRVMALGFSKSFYVELNDEMELRDGKDCNYLLATEEDLFRIWSLLRDIPVSRFDLPETAHGNALKVFSLLAELPYIRAVNIANVKGKPSLALEIIKQHSPSQIVLSS